jgi:hypothetical protein
MRFQSRPAYLAVALALALTFALSSVFVALAATTDIGTDPFTQATCKGSASTNDGRGDRHV